MNKSNRVNVSTTQRTTESMSHNGWDLQFSYERIGEEAPQSVTVQGTKKEANAASIYVSKNLNQTNVVFNNTAFDTDLVAALVTELDIIMPAK